MDHLYPGLILLLAVARAVFLILRRSRHSPLPRRALAWRFGIGVGLPALMAIYNVDLFDGFWLLEVFVSLPFNLLAALALGRVLAQAWCWPSWRLSLLAGLGFATTAACLFHAREIGIPAYLLRHQFQYERVVTRVRAEPALRDGNLVGVTYMVARDPIRVAFPWGGLLDNWYGAVYDPTGGVMRGANDPTILKLFGGDLLGARHLWGPWYLCWFT